MRHEIMFSILLETENMHEIKICSAIVQRTVYALRNEILKFSFFGCSRFVEPLPMEKLLFSSG